MKVKELILRNYKGFGPDAAPISFCDAEGKPNDLTVIIGKNASGKSSILQAIAMLVGAKVRGTEDPKKLKWPGFKYEYIGNRISQPTVSVSIEFSEEEVGASIEFFEKATNERFGLQYVPVIDVYLDAIHDHVKTETPLPWARETKSLISSFAIQHFMGYFYAMKLNGGEEALSRNLSRVGGIFWYPEQREARDIHRAIYSGNFDGNGSITESELRNILLRWFTSYVTSNQPEIYGVQNGRDRFGILKRLYEEIFSGRTINRMAPDASPERIMEDALIWFRDENGQEYELSNASAGERAIFPILVDFSNWEINNSIILIDEIELHLHPPLQQALLKALSKLGKNNQFIITTHSPHIIAMVKPEQVMVVKDFQVFPLNRNTLGRDSNSILNDVFGIPERPKEYVLKLNRFYDSIDKQDDATATQLFEELQNDWGLGDLEIVKAEWRLMELKSELDSHAIH